MSESGTPGTTAPESEVRLGETTPRIGKWFKYLLLICLVAGTGWVGHKLTQLVEVPDGVRTYRKCSEALETHANDIRGGRLQPEDDPNGIVRYSLTPELRRAGITVCIVKDEIIWYYLPSHPLDNGGPCLITPLDPTFPVTQFPRRVQFGTLEFRRLPGNWAYWYVLTG